MNWEDELSCQPKKDYSMGEELGRIRKLKILAGIPHQREME
jgi:hypothetical protein